MEAAQSFRMEKKKPVGCAQVGCAGLLILSLAFVGVVMNSGGKPSSPDRGSYAYAAQVAGEADAKRGLAEGKRVGGNRRAEGYGRPTREYLDFVLTLAVKGESEEFREAFKTGYLSAWD